MRPVSKSVLVCAAVVAAIDAAALSWFISPLGQVAPISPVTKTEPVTAVATGIGQDLPDAGPMPVGAQAGTDALTSLGGSSEPGTWPAWCSAGITAPWLMSAVRPDGTHLAVQIMAAGQGSRAWPQISQAAADCPEMSTLTRDDQHVTLARYDVPLVWSISRHGDILTSAYRLGTTSSSQAAQVQDVAQKLAASSGKACQVDDRQALTRNPHVPGYQPWAPRLTINVPVPGFPKPPRTSTEILWRAPSPVSRPELAPIVAPTATLNPLTSVIAPTGAAPVLVDPNAIAEPAFPRPQAPSPSVTNTPAATVVAPVRVVDSHGPGCGWQFAGTVAPAVTQDAARQGDTDLDTALMNSAQAAAPWVGAQAVGHANAAAYALASAQLQAWNQYDLAVQQATRQWDAATRRRASTLERWNAGWQPPVVPQPTASSIEPSPSPWPSVTTTQTPVTP